MDMKERAEVIAKQEEAMRVSYFEEHITLKGKTPVCLACLSGLSVTKHKV